ncbi:hypothetical protein ACFSQT_36875 [Mesorhizobium calcicola]|uniref:Uncharacterized protein n=1 Tax=Mesorhizobium calcicola TaxID=1300310 RepID=A0ABW4WPH6_9HYPH
MAASRHHPPQDVYHREFRNVLSAASRAFGSLPRLTRLDGSRFLRRQAKAGHGEPERALEEDKVWDPFLLFPQGVGTALTIQKFREMPDHKPVCLHHNPVRGMHRCVHEIAIADNS